MGEHPAGRSGAAGGWLGGSIRGNLLLPSGCLGAHSELGSKAVCTHAAAGERSRSHPAPSSQQQSMPPKPAPPPPLGAGICADASRPRPCCKMPMCFLQTPKPAAGAGVCAGAAVPRAAPELHLLRGLHSAGEHKQLLQFVACLRAVSRQVQQNCICFADFMARVSSCWTVAVCVLLS